MVFSTAIWSFYLLTTRYETMLAITFLYAVFRAPIISFLEAFTMDVLAGEKKSYGRIRVWGSLSFILTVVVVGKVIDHYAIDLILYLILTGSILQGVLSLKLPDLKTKKNSAYLTGIRLLLNKQVIVFLCCGLLMLVSHGTYYGFFSIHLESLGYDKMFIGITWSVAVIAEILVMISSRRMLKVLSLKKVLFYSFAAAALRWLALFMFRSPVAILLTQVLHAFSYGTFHIASILYIDRLAPDEAKTVGQAVNNSITYGLGMMAGFLLNGYLYEPLGSYALFGISGLIALTGGVLVRGLKLPEPGPDSG